jgi:basic membrane protein A
MVTLAEPSDLVDAEAKTLITEKAAAIIDGSFAPFTGPINDQDGKQKLGEGEKADLGQLLSMDFFVEGVEGSPKG